MKPTRNPFHQRGFALVVTLSMMVLLTVIVVGTLSLSAVTLRSVDKDAAQAVARANARLAMMIAIGQLQKEAGPDQRVTGSAEIVGSDNNPYWTGAWKAGRNSGDSQPVWLVSGSNPDPARALDDSNSAVLANPPASESSRKELRAEYVTIEGDQLDGRYAYWVGDEATKVRVDVGNPMDKDNLGLREKIGRSQSPQEPGFAAFDSKHKATWAGFDSDYSGAIDRRTLISMGTVALAAKDSGDLDRDEIPKRFFNDLTTGGFGLPVNVRDGGMKNDLSLILDTTQQNESFVQNFLGARPISNTISKATIYTFPNPDPARFSLSPTITNSYSGGFVGPNWGILYNYARMWETVDGTSKTEMIGLLPRVDSDLRQNTWLPYREANKGTDFMEDMQHTNSGLSPVISLFQLGFYLRTERMGGSEDGVPMFAVSILMKPIVGLWNPYNVSIADSVYQVESASGPALLMTTENIGTSTGPPYESPMNPPIHLREYWTVGGSAFPTDTSQGGSYIRLRTTPVDFQPGEFRLFTVAGSPNLTETNTIHPNYNIDGAYTIRLSAVDSQGRRVSGIPMRYRAGSRLGVSAMTMQDTHNSFLPYTRQKFPNIGLNAANIWLTLKAGASSINTHLNRYTDLWNGGKESGDSSLVMPEQVTSSGGLQKETYSVEQLAVPQHIATWRFYTRNSTEALGDQGLRGWIDANPRVMSNNFRFDGSKNSDGDVQGWNVSANLIAGRSNPSIGDGQGGNRGLVAEGSVITNMIPEGPVNDNRWQGLTGPASTNAEGGLTHVIVYDVPQAPLTSIGQFQHANLSRYGFEPGFVVGNSYANLRIPPNSIAQNNFGNMGFTVADISYEANEKLWDTSFFSTLAPDYKGGGSFDTAFDRNALLLRTQSLPNPRMVYTELPGDQSISKTIRDAGSNAPQTISTRIMIEGAFNVNSTSKTAWKAILSTMDGSELPVIDPKTLNRTWELPGGIRFSRFNHPILNAGYSGGSRDASFWQGWRELSDTELDDLAEAIVEEVKSRGPFRSMAEFVNRNPYSGKSDHQLKGALQAAIDNSVNKSINTDVGLPTNNPKGQNFYANVAGENQAAGHAAYLLQGDILQCLAPIMQVRSDYFRIRTCGEALDKTGKVIARVWCEAFVQRMPDYVDPMDAPEAPFDRPTSADPYAKDELRSEVNKTFGRRMQLISFRWLNPSEI